MLTQAPLICQVSCTWQSSHAKAHLLVLLLVLPSVEVSEEVVVPTRDFSVGQLEDRCACQEAAV